MPLLLLVLSGAPLAAPAQQKEEPEVSWRIVLRSGAYLNGQLLRQDALEIELIDREGNHVVVERELVSRVECLKGSVTAKVGELEIEERARTEVREAGARAARRAVESLSDAEVVQRAVEKLALRLVADEELAFDPSELGRGRWKWAVHGEANTGSSFAYGTERPDPKRVRDIGSLLYHLERIEREPGIVWVPYRWDPKSADWSLRAYCPPALRAHRELVQQRALLERAAEALARVDARWRALPPAEAQRAQEKRLLDQTREGYDEILRRYLAQAEQARAFVRAQIALPATDRVPAKEGALR